MSDITNLTLEGRTVRLEPLSVEHLAGLVAAASGDRSTFQYTGVPRADIASVEAYIRTAREDRDAQRSIAFATIHIDRGFVPATSSGLAHSTTARVVGSTRFMAIERWRWPAGIDKPPDVAARVHPESVEIGGTWLHLDAQRSSVNTEAKLLMLTHAFEAWGCYRVTLRADERNARSRAAIERIGAHLEGIIRNQMYAYDGQIRNTAQYAVLAENWPEVKERLRSSLVAGP